jgi:hypothetical protein
VIDPSPRKSKGHKYHGNSLVTEPRTETRELSGDNLVFAWSIQGGSARRGKRNTLIALEAWPAASIDREICDLRWRTVLWRESVADVRLCGTPRGLGRRRLGFKRSNGIRLPRLSIRRHVEQ